MTFFDELNAGRRLADIKKEWLFNYPVGLTEEHGKYLINLFYAYFGARQIGHIMPLTFRNWVRARYESTWHSQFKPLFESILAVHLSNFALTRKSVEVTNEDVNKLSRGYSLNNSGSTHSASSEESTDTQSSNAGVGNKMGWEMSGSAQTTKASHFTKRAGETRSISTDDNLETDSPQNTSLAPPTAPEKTGVGNYVGEDPQPTPSAKAFYEGSLPVWNEGVLSKAGRINKSGQNKEEVAEGQENATYEQDIKSGAQGETNDEWHEAYSSQSGGSNTYSADRATATAVTTGGELEGRNIYRQVSEFSGVALPDLMVKYRETLAPIEREWLKLFKQFFLRTY